MFLEYLPIIWTHLFLFRMFLNFEFITLNSYKSKVSIGKTSCYIDNAVFSFNTTSSCM